MPDLWGLACWFVCFSLTLRNGIDFLPPLLSFSLSMSPTSLGTEDCSPLSIRSGVSGWNFPVLSISLFSVWHLLGTVSIPGDTYFPWDAQPTSSYASSECWIFKDNRERENHIWSRSWTGKKNVITPFWEGIKYLAMPISLRLGHLNTRKIPAHLRLNLSPFLKMSNSLIPVYPRLCWTVS